MRHRIRQSSEEMMVVGEHGAAVSHDEDAVAVSEEEGSNGRHAAEVCRPVPRDLQHLGGAGLPRRDRHVLVHVAVYLRPLSLDDRPRSLLAKGHVRVLLSRQQLLLPVHVLLPQQLQPVVLLLQLLQLLHRILVRHVLAGNRLPAPRPLELALGRTPVPPLRRVRPQPGKPPGPHTREGTLYKLLVQGRLRQLRRIRHPDALAACFSPEVQVEPLEVEGLEDVERHRRWPSRLHRNPGAQ
eukprot:758476-Hanusia_phi.AAC.1